MDLTKEILEEKGFTIDEEGFNAAMQKQKETARNSRAKTNYMGADVTVYESIDPSITSVFVGYDNLQYNSKISVLTTDTELTQALADGDVGTIIVDETPFYATMGGQEADKGVITTSDAEFEVEDTIKLLGGKVGHVGKVTKGMFKVGDTVTLKVNEEIRNSTAKNHSATHLLQKALRIVLGNHVEQAGSLVNANHLRFDFTHFQALTKEELDEVEKIVNEKIAEQLPVETKVMTIEEAKKTGATALFGEKYGETVRVVNMSEFSKEFCGGTHVKNTGSITLFKIVSESGVAAGVRRIEALTGQGVLDYYKNVENTLNKASKVAKSEPVKLTDKIESLLEEIKVLRSENESLKSKLANNSLGDVMNNVKEVNGYQVLTAKVEGVDMNGLRNLGDSLKEKLECGVIVLASSQGKDKVNLIAMVTDEAVKKGAHAGNIIKAIAPSVGGGGGGRPNMAQAGGKNSAGIDEALAKVMDNI
jgi:alanyl-tRNA synthetase